MTAAAEAASRSSPPTRLRDRASTWLPEALRPDPTRLAYAANIALITVLTLYLGFLLNLQNTYWGLIGIPFVAQIGSGVTVWRSAMRVVGTLAGGIVGLAIIACFAQNAGASIAALAFWVFGVGYLARFEVGLDAYAYGTAGLTAIVIVFDTGPSGDLAYGLALARLTETLIPVGAAFAILLVVFPKSVEDTLRQGLDSARKAVLSVVHQALTPGETPSIKDRQAATKALSAAQSNLRAYRFERSHRGPDVAKVGAAANRLNHLLVAAEALSLTLEGGSAGDSTPLAEPMAELDRLIAALPTAFGGAEPAAEAAKTFRDFLDRLNADPATHLSHVRIAEAGAHEITALHALRRFAAAMAAFLEAEAAVYDPTKPAPRERTIAARYPDRLAAIQRGFRPALLVVLAASVWVASASASLQAVAMLIGSLSLVLPTIAPRASLAGAGVALGLGLAAMAPAALTLQAVLPYVETFPVFALIIAAVMFVFFYLCSAPGRLIYAFGGTIMLAITLQPSNMQTYNPLGLFNIGAALAILPSAIAVAFTVIIPEDQNWLRRHLRRGCRKLLQRAANGTDAEADEFLAQGIDVIGDYGGDLDAVAEPNHRLLRRSRLSLVAGLELYELHRLRRLGHLPAELGALVTGIGEAVLAAWTEGKTDPTAFDEARRLGLERARDETANGPARNAAIRFLIANRFLQDLVETRLPPESGKRT